MIRILAIFLIVEGSSIAGTDPSPTRQGVVLELAQIKETYLQLCPYPLSIDFPEEFGMSKRFKEPLQVSISFVVARLVEINDVEKRLSLFGQFSMYWKHPCNITCQHLLGNNSDLCDLPDFRSYATFLLPKGQTWYPKFLQMNGYKQGAPVDSFVYFHIGMIPSYSFVPAIGTIDTACDSFSFKRFPFDVLDCDVQFYTTDQLYKVTYAISYFEIQDDVKLVSDPDIWEHVPPLKANVALFPFVHGYKDNGVWFKIKFKRKYQHFVCSILLPTFALVVLQIGGLIMPPDIPDRSSYAITVVLAYMFLLSMVFSEIPRTSEPVYFVYMVTANLLAGVAVTLYSLVTCELATRENWRKIVVFSKMNRFEIQKIRLLDLTVGIGTCITMFLLDGIFYGMMLQ